MKSMTGFGIAEYADETLQISAEIKTINHRYKDFNIRISRKFSPLEDAVRKYVGGAISRGRIEIGIKMKSFGEDAATLHYDRETAHRYMDILHQLHADFPELTNDVSVTTLSRYPDVIVAEEATVDLTAAWEKLRATLDKALQMLETSRTQEGETLKLDFISRCGLVRRACGEIEELSEEIPQNYYQQLMKNVQDYTKGVVDEQRLLTEMAIYAERCNITEELVRLKSHLSNFEKIVESKEPVGRKLDFLFQEINREANTIASKSNSFAVSTLVVEIKSELEKMREQIQNIE